MACSIIDRSDGGFATPAAAMVSLVVGLGAAALVEAGWTELKLARADLAKAQIEAALAGAQELSAVFLLTDGSAGGGQAIGGRDVQVLAEPEGMKASIKAVLGLDERGFAPLGVARPRALKDRLKALTVAQAVGPELELADPSPQWRACARSLISPFGQGQTLRSLPASNTSSDGVVSRAGEVWRLRAKDDSGWVDDRIVRLTVDSLHPAATLVRRLWKPDQESAQCQIVFDNPK